jgi:hypothetical protein
LVSAENTHLELPMTLQENLAYLNAAIFHKHALVNGVANINPGPATMEIHPPQRDADTSAVGIYCVMPNGERIALEVIEEGVRRVMEYNHSVTAANPQAKPKRVKVVQRGEYLEGMK